MVAAAQTRMGTAVFAGMLVATFFGVFIIPGLFSMVERIRFGKKKAPAPAGPAKPPATKPVAARPEAVPVAGD